MAASAVMTPIGTLCFPALFEPRPAQQGGEPRYSCILLFDDVALKTQQYQDLRKAVHAAIAEKWGAQKAQDPAFLRALRLPFRAASEKDYQGFDKGTIFISPWSKARPGVLDVNGAHIHVPSDVWAGQLARATVRAFAYDQSGNKGAAFGLEHVQIVKADMPRIDGRRSAEAAFANADNSQLAAMGIDINSLAGPASGTGGGGGAALGDDDLPF